MVLPKNTQKNYNDSKAVNSMSDLNAFLTPFFIPEL